MGYYWEGEFLLLEILIGANKYMSLTNKVDINPAENPVYNALINQGTSDYQRDKKSAENGFMRETWKTYLFSKEGI